MLGVDKYVPNPTFTQDYNSYTYARNNPLTYNDPTGNYFGFDDVLAMLIGGTINLVSNLADGHVHSFTQGLMYFSVGAVSGELALFGPAGWVAGGALQGYGNAMLGGVPQNQILSQTLAGAAAGLVGGAAGQWAGNGIGGLYINGLNVTSPVLKSAVTGAIGGAAGGYAGGFTGGLIMSGGNIGAANQAGVNGMVSGLTTGAVTGAVSGYQAAKDAGINPWTGENHRTYILGGPMDNVRTSAEILEAQTIENNVIANWNNDLSYEAKLDFNSWWMDEMIDRQDFIIDIGRNPNLEPSPFYQGIEVPKMQNSPNVYQPIFMPQMNATVIIKKY
jgi:hypothetical protein